MKLTTDRHEASRGLFATAELLVLVRSQGNPYDGFNKTGCVKPAINTEFSINKSLYLGNDRRQKISYSGILIGSRIWAFDWYQFRMTVNTSHSGARCEDSSRVSSGSIDISDVHIVNNIAG